MSKLYLVTLKPLTPFFFGGEKTFNTIEEEVVNYDVKSNYLPQQSTILGMLRYELLAQNGFVGKPHTPVWDILIGCESFDGSNSTIRAYGAIKQLSPIFLSNGSSHFIPQSLDWYNYKNADGSKVGKMQVAFDDINQGMIHQNQLKSIASIKIGAEPYDPKYEIKELWVSSDGLIHRQYDFDTEFEKKDFYENGFFVKHKQVGIHRQKDKKKGHSDGGFYKQTFYSIMDDFCFAFFLDLDIPSDKKLGHRIVQMGGERSTFDMNIEEADNKTFDSIFTKETFGSYPQDAIVLTSPAYADASVFEHCKLAISDHIPFRNIRTIDKSSSDYTRIKGGAIQKQAEVLYLLKQGSVLYCQNIAKVTDCLNKPHFFNIGYNHFISY